MKHEFWKGLVTSKGDSINKYGKGKGQITERCASVKRHGIGKGLMTVWLATNAYTGGFPTGFDIVERAKEKKKKLQQRQSILVRHLVQSSLRTISMRTHRKHGKVVYIHVCVCSMLLFFGMRVGGVVVKVYSFGVKQKCKRV